MSPAGASRMRELADRFDGSVLTPGDHGYDAARRVWNAMIDRRPRLITRCASTADVVAAVRFAREHDLEIGVRGGGHGVLGLAVPDGGLMIDLSGLGGVVVDPVRHRARVQGGALLGALDRAAQQHGLVTTAGNVSHTGAGGLTLGGGMGWLARRIGLTCDNMTDAQLVTADGDLRSAAEDPDLLWGLRGGGGNFGIVTELDLRLHALDTRAVSVELDFPLDAALPALRGWRDLLADAPRCATLTARVEDTPEGPQAVVGYVWIGDPEQGRRWLPTLQAVGRPVAERVEELTYVALQCRDDTAEGHQRRRYWKGHYLDAFTDDAIEAFLLRGTSDGRGEHLPTVGLQAYGGAVADVPVGGSAFAHRGAAVEYVASAGWSDPAQDTAWIAAARQCAAALDGFATGAYVNTLSDEGGAGVRRAYPPDTLARLTALKRRLDPGNTFHLNHNIRP